MDVECIPWYIVTSIVFVIGTNEIEVVDIDKMRMVYSQLGMCPS